MRVLREWLTGWMPDNWQAYLPERVGGLGRLGWFTAGFVLLVILAWWLRGFVGRRDAVRIASFSQIAKIAPRLPPLRQWLVWGFTAFMVWNVAALLVAKPIRLVAEPFEQATSIGVSDTSDTMTAADIEPNRGVAAEEAYREFVSDSPEDVQHAWITFGGAASLQVPPTTDRVYLFQAIDQIELGRKTALIDGIDLALDVCERIPSSDDGVLPCRIAILSDGDESVIEDEQERERRVTALISRAQRLGVSIDTIGYGTDESTLYRGELVKVAPNPELLRQIASGSGGQFYEAANASQLSAAYEQVGSSFGYKYVERTAWEFFVLMALVSGLFAALSYLVFYNQILHAPRCKAQVDTGRPQLRTVA